MVGQVTGQRDSEGQLQEQSTLLGAEKAIGRQKQPHRAHTTSLKHPKSHTGPPQAASGPSPSPGKDRSQHRHTPTLPPTRTAPHSAGSAWRKEKKRKEKNSSSSPSQPTKQTYRQTDRNTRNSTQSEKRRRRRVHLLRLAATPHPQQRRCCSSPGAASPNVSLHSPLPLYSYSHAPTRRERCRRRKLPRRRRLCSGGRGII